MHVHVPDHGMHGQVPRGALAGAGLLVLLTVVLCALARLTDVGSTRVPVVAAVTVVDLRFTDLADGSVAVTRDPDGRRIGTLAAGTQGFARSTLRGFVRERVRSGIGAGPAFRLTRWADGRLSLSDPATGRSVELDVFGPTNVAVFAQLLLAGAP